MARLKTVANDQDRTDFETWASESFTEEQLPSLEKNEFGEYIWTAARIGWEVWKELRRDNV